MELLGAVIEDHRGGLGLSAVGTKWLLGWVWVVAYPLAAWLNLGPGSAWGVCHIWGCETPLAGKRSPSHDRPCSQASPMAVVHVWPAGVTTLGWVSVPFPGSCGVVGLIDTSYWLFHVFETHILKTPSSLFQKLLKNISSEVLPECLSQLSRSFAWNLTWIFTWKPNFFQRH